jgi:ribosomal protein L29
MDWVWPIIENPFTWGLSLGLLVAAFVLKNAFTARGHFKREIARLKTEIDDLQRHINTHLKITATGSERLEKELAALKEQNENLRVNFAAVQQKPGRTEVRQLQVYDGAIAKMREQAPGFAQAWERALRESNAEQDAAEGGLTRLIRKVFPGTTASTPESPGLPSPADKPALESPPGGPVSS